MQRKLIIGAVSAALALVLGTGSAEATIYAAPTGSDGAPGTAAEPVRSVGRALALVGTGEAVELAPGLYPKPARIGSGSYTDARRHPATVLVSGEGAILQGFRLAGAHNVVFRGVTFTDTLLISGGRGIGVERSEFRDMGTALSIRGGAEQISVHANYFHDLGSAIVGPNYGSIDPRIAKHSRAISVTGNLVEDIRTDGMQFSWWRDVRIEGNTFRRLSHPTGKLHNDGIQVIGNNVGVQILRNRISHSDGQGIFVQPAVGPNADVRVEGNLIHDTAAIPLYLSAASGLQVLGNTVWRSSNVLTGVGIVVKGTGQLGEGAIDAVVMSNVTSSLALYSPIAARDRNIVAYKNPVWARFNAPGPLERIAGDPLFVDRPGGDFRLSVLSPARGIGLPGLGAGVDGLPRGTPPNAGAFG